MKKLVSPDGRVRGDLIIAGEIRFGPAYYHLRLPEYDFSNRIFGSDYLFSQDSRFMAIQEWLSTDYVDGPFTELLLIDFQLERQCPLSKAQNGYISPIRFEPPQLIYRKDYYGRGESREYEIEFEVLDRWRPVTRLIP